MPTTKLTPKQEAFAASIVSGLSIVDAYRQHYSTDKYSTNGLYVNATKLAKQTKVALRVAELKASRDAETEATELFSIAVSRQKLLSVYEAALSAKHYGAAVSALAECNKISGFHVQKLEVSGTVTHRDESLAEFTTAELKEFVKSKRAALPVPDTTTESVTEAEYRDLDT